MGEHLIALSGAEWQTIVTHLLPDPMRHEEAGFLFVDAESRDAGMTFKSVEWLPLAPGDFESRSVYHLALTDEARAGAIRRAHQLRCSMVELHSHSSHDAAEFSPSDLRGFDEFVPHVRWRLRGRPYGAVVVAPGSFDAFVWSGQAGPRRLAIEIEPGGRILSPTGLSPLHWGPPR